MTPPESSTDSGVVIAEYRGPDRPAIERLIARDPAAQVYASPHYHAALEQITGGRCVTLTAADRKTGRVVGVMAYLEREHPELGCVLNALPWFGSHGSPRVEPELEPAEADRVAAALAGAFARRADAALSGTLVLSPLDTPSWHEAVIRAFGPHGTLDRVAQVTPLPPPGDDALDRLLMDVFSQKTRNLARKALRQGFDIADEADGPAADEAWAFLAEVHAANMHAIGATPKPATHLAALRDMPRDMRALYVARDNGRPVAALLTLTSGRVVEYFVPAVLAEERSRQPNTALIVRAMLDAIDAGRTTWNWGGTPPANRSLHHFKAGFGAADRPYAYLTRLGTGGKIAGETPESLARAFPGWFVAPYDLLGGTP